MLNTSNEILRDIWSGGRGLDLAQEQSAEEKDILNALESCDEQLEGVLRKDDWDLLEKYRNLSLSLCAECEYQAFKIGYNFGIKMIIEAIRG
ncbi:MAG: hypothetical protein K2L19_01950 [Eubacterium sp.]|nr:hypothetical protein [Eubacterium sp.]